ncbi:MAG: phage holin family protein [Candidatus Staskawiczbacteria bacterium]|jgi:putative membrane protein
MMRRLISNIIAATLGLWLALLFVSQIEIKAYPSSHFFGIPLTAQWQIILVLGIVLGLLNYFLKPILKALALPLEILSLGLFTIVINMALIWLLDLIFDEIYTPFFLPMLYTTLIVWGLNIIIGLFLIKKN